MYVYQYDLDPIIFISWLRRLQENFRNLFKLLKWTMTAVNIHWRTVFAHGIWIGRKEAQLALESGYKMLEPCHSSNIFPVYF